MKKLLATTAAVLLLLSACGGGDKEASGGDGDFCDASVEFFEVQSGGVDPTDQDAQKTLFENITEVTEKLAATAPDDIKEDTETLATGVKKLSDLLASVDYQIENLSEDQQAELQDQTLSTSITSVMTYMQENCPEVKDKLVQPDSTDTTPPETAPVETPEG